MQIIKPIKRNDALINAVLAKIHRAYNDSNLADVATLIENIPESILIEFANKK